MDAPVIDAFEFCRLKEHREGSMALGELHRLSEVVVGDAGPIAWSLQGGSDNLGHSRLVLGISGSVKLACQRCLGTLDFDISSESTLIIAKDEDDADHIDSMLSDDDIDVIVGSKLLQVADLIEDEALLAMPLSVKHDVCPDDANTVGDGLKKPSSFAALKNLKL
ncbi:DUF177 domain-containing protein [Actimicrobium antarcticum]|uniref:Large ribosomal RNA subunit accumulation protein YceD n=1 Tax=Actimicrobium antarcticum TaxID=1051899 RepID=A0ABP7T0W5_9BURK